MFIILINDTSESMPQWSLSCYYYFTPKRKICWHCWCSLDRRQVGHRVGWDVMVVRKKIAAPARYQIILTQPTARYCMNTGHTRIWDSPCFSPLFMHVLRRYPWTCRDCLLPWPHKTFITIFPSHFRCRAMDQVVHQSFTFEAQIEYQAHPCRISGGQSGNGAGFPLSILVFPCQFRSTDVPQ